MFLHKRKEEEEEEEEEEEDDDDDDDDDEGRKEILREIDFMGPTFCFSANFNFTLLKFCLFKKLLFISS